MSLEKAARTLARATAALRFSPPAHFVLAPLEYAWAVHAAYLQRYGTGKKRFVLLGMNPGPFGMGQTGIPFGEVAAVRDYLQLRGAIHSPAGAPPQRPILGFECTRSEVSGHRLWGAIAAKHPDPNTFFAQAFVANYCPLLFLDAMGANVTPEKLKRAERTPLERVCDEHLRTLATELAPERWIAIGKYAEACIVRVFGAEAPRVVLPHPSPASPAANRGWREAAVRALHERGIVELI